MSDLLHGMADHIHHLEKVAQATRESQIAMLQQLSELEKALDKLNARILSDNYAQQLKKLELIQQRVTAAFDKLKIVEVRAERIHRHHAEQNRHAVV